VNQELERALLAASAKVDAALAALKRSTEQFERLALELCHQVYRIPPK